MKMYAIISGRVQGVFFRKFVKGKAQSLGITGTAKNLTNGDVEVVAYGDPEKLREFGEYLKEGSKLSKVENVEADFTDGHEDPKPDFDIG